MNTNDKTYFTDGPMQGEFLRDYFLEGVRVIRGDFEGHYEYVHLMEWVEDNKGYKLVPALRYFPPAVVVEPDPAPGA